MSDRSYAGTEQPKRTLRPSVPAEFREAAPRIGAEPARRPRWSWLARLRNRLAAMLAADARRRRNRRQAAALLRLDDRLLRDIGLTRIEIEHMIDHAKRDDS